MNCLQCNTPLPAHNKKFCNSSCAAKYNNSRRKPRSVESKLKTSLAIKNLPEGVGIRSLAARNKAHEQYSETRLKNLFETPFDELAHQSKRVRIIIEQEGKCAHCDISEWMGQPVCFEMDHIDGNNQNNVRENLEILCPNCHSNTPTWKGRKAERNRDKINEYIQLRRRMVESAGAAPARER